MTTIKLYDTGVRAKREFVPLDPENVRMYVCGPTVYDRAHLGNARPVLVFDVLNRLLRHVYGADHVTYVRNFTDVDDRINATALARAEAGDERSLEHLIHERSDETIDWYHQDMDALGAIRPDHEPRATEFIGAMVAMIKGLIAGGYAYEAEGHVLFAVESYTEYGALSGRSIDDMIAGARVEVAPYKRNPMDFVLWKPSTGDLPGWPSPWGRGRPGWHIECSAMAFELLGAEFDIHGGGNDLTFPHHENEIAQSRCMGHGFARYWLHNEMLQVEGRKMSKSLGNFFTVRDLLDQGVPGEVIRFVMLSTHYRKPMDWTERKREEAEATLRKWRTLTEISRGEAKVPQEIVSALSDDLNSPLAISVLHKLANDGNGAALLKGAEMMGFLSAEMGNWFVFGAVSISGDDRVDRIMKIRAAARAAGNYTLSDSFRDSLLKIGVAVFDKKESCAGYFEPQFLKRQLMSFAHRFWQDGFPEKAKEAVETARSAGLTIHFEDGTGPSAVSGFDEEKANAFFDLKISEILKNAEASK